MEKHERDYQNNGDNPSEGDEEKEPADVTDGPARDDPTAGGDCVGIDYRRLIDEQRFELEELKRAARDASPSSSSRHPPERASSTTADDVTAAVPPLSENSSDGEPQLPPPPPPPLASIPRPHVVDGVIYGRSGDDNGVESSRRSLEKMAAGAGGAFYRRSTIGGGGYPGGAGGDTGRRYSRCGVLGGNFLAAVTRETRKREMVDAGRADDPPGLQTAATTNVRFERPAGASGDRPPPRELRLGARESSSDSGRFVDDEVGVGPSAIADEALAALEKRRGSARGGVSPGKDSAQRRQPYRSSVTGDTSASTEVLTAGPGAMGDGGVGLDPGFAIGNSASRNKQIYSGENDAPPPLKVAPAATKPTPPPSEYGRKPSTCFHAQSTEAVADGDRDGRDTTVDSAGYRRDASLAENTRLTDRRGTGEKLLLGSRPLVGSSWSAVSGGGWGVDGGFGGMARGERREGGGEAFRSASWADKLVVKREEQSVLVKQLERELASTVSALKDERKGKRDQTEALKGRLEKARGTLGDREAELARRERMTATLMAELEAMRSRCDRLSASREERAEEADKMMTRLREDNRELEARLRQADAAAAEAREGRAGADAERVRMERDLHSALAKATSAERRLEEEAEASTAAAEIASRELREAKVESEGLRSELESLRRRLEEEGSAGVVGSLRAQVADLERHLATANQRCVALEARLGLLERELVEAEGGEVEARARLRWALGQLGESFPAAGAAGDAATASDGLQRGGNTAAAAPAAESMARNESRTSDRPYAGGRATGPTPAAESPPPQSPCSPSSSAGRLTRGVLTTPPSPGKSVDDIFEEEKNVTGPPGGSGSIDGSNKVKAAQEAEQEREEEFREPNWRSMVPVLFPPGWRDREIAAAAAVAARVEGRTTGADAAAAAASMDGEGIRVESPAARSAREVHSRRASGWDSRLHATEDYGDDYSSDDAEDQCEDERGVRVREEDTGDSYDGAVVTDFITTAGTRQRQRGAEGDSVVTSHVDENENGVSYDTSEGRIHAALDHLTAEEQRFALEGGVETEYGEWQHDKDDGLEHEHGPVEGEHTGESGRIPRYGYDGESDYDDSHDGGNDIPSPVQASGDIETLRRSLRKNSHRHPAARAGETRRRASSPKAKAGRPKVSGRGAEVAAGAPSRQIGVEGARLGASNVSIASVTDRGRPRSGRLTRQSSAGVRPTGMQDRQQGSYLSAGKRRVTDARVASASKEISGGTTRRRLSARAFVSMSPAATKSAPKTGAGRPPSHPRSTAGASAILQQHSRRRDQSNPPGVEVSRAVVRRRSGEGGSAGNGRGPGSLGARLREANVSLGSISTKPRSGRSALARSSFGAGTCRLVGGGSVNAGLGEVVVPRRHRRGDGHQHVSARESIAQAQDGSGMNESAVRRASKSAARATAAGADVGRSTSYALAGARLGSSTAREHVSLMRRRKERGGLGSGSASRAGAGVASEHRVGRRGTGGSSGGTADSSVCSSRVWKP